MPRINIHVTAEGHPLNQELLTLDVASNLSVADLKGYVNAETNFPPSRQEFYLDGQFVSGDDKTLEQVGIKDGEMLAVLIRPENQPAERQQSTQRGQPAGGSGRPVDMSSPDHIEATRQRFLHDQHALAQVRSQRPELAEAINDPNRFRVLFEELLGEERDRERERQNQMRLLNEDPFNIDAQRKIEEMIRQDRVLENLQHAYEHNPEVFGRVTMLYVNTVVNGKAVKAFVDSGAQTTIMSPSCAESCGIMRLVDTRYSGIAKGVGTAKILGRVHSADIRIGNQTMPCSFTVMEGKDVDLLLGLDMLKRHQASIDLKRNKLVFEDNEVDFLPESELPKWVEEAQEAEPTIQGPHGTEIGAETGTVKPATSSTAPTTNGNFKGAGQSLSTPSPGPVLQPTPAAQSGPSAPPPLRQAARPAASQHPKESIDQLVSLGFSRNEAIAALDATGGNVEYAAGLLFQG